jgi:hypothetical protein
MIINISLFERLLHRLHLLPTPVMDAFGGVLFGRALTIAVRRGVFESLAQTPRTFEEVARATSLSLQGTELILESCVVAGYISAANGRYSLTGEARKWLVKDSPFFLGNLIRYFETLYERWGYLEHSLEHGSPPRRYYEQFTDDDWKVYVYGMRDLARLLIGEVRKKLVLPPNPKHLLDLGGSHGLYAMDCSRRHPGLHVQIIDFAEALRHTAAIVQEEEMEGRVTLTAGDFTSMELPSEQDCILIFNVIHGFSEAENQKLLDRAIASLVPGGKLFVLDQMKTESKGSPLSRFVPLMVGLNLLNEIGGNTYTSAQVKGWCRSASSVKHYRLRFPGVSLIEATR